MQKTIALASAAIVLSAGAAALAAENPNATIRQLNGMAVAKDNAEKVRQIFALEREGKTAEADAIYATLPEGVKRGVDNGRAARDGKLDPKSQAIADQTKGFYAAVKGGDVETVIASFAAFGDKARPGVLKTLNSMVEAGRVTPAMAEAIGTLKAA